MDLKSASIAALHEYLLAKGQITGRLEDFLISSAGEGNMNYVIRVRHKSGSLILKQSLSYVNKYPQIAAPIERIHVEQRFYKTVSSEFMPKILHFDQENNILFLEDLGESTDFMGIYASSEMFKVTYLKTLESYLQTIHSQTITDFPSNIGMKTLNHEHIFNYPFVENNGLDLDSMQDGLKGLAFKYIRNASLMSQIKELGNKYLSGGEILLHGDFYPGSWLLTMGGIKIIDPEFAFLGDAEFDYGVLNAHLLMANLPPLKENNKLTCQYNGVEVLRRILGIAQLPLKLTLEQKEALCDDAVKNLL